jgi:hypothetical protein
MATVTIANSKKETAAEARRTSSSLQPAQSGRDKVLHAADLRLQVPAAFGGDLVRPAAVVALEGLDHAFGLEASDCAIQSARPEPSACDGLDVVDHRVAVFGSAGEARKNEEGGVIS